MFKGNYTKDLVTESRSAFIKTLWCESSSELPFPLLSKMGTKADGNKVQCGIQALV